MTSFPNSASGIAPVRRPDAGTCREHTVLVQAARSETERALSSTDRLKHTGLSPCMDGWGRTGLSFDGPLLTPLVHPVTPLARATPLTPPCHPSAFLRLVALSVRCAVGILRTLTT
eukprot:1193711-Prorocentrum_minimum.AAC.2